MTPGLEGIEAWAMALLRNGDVVHLRYWLLHSILKANGDLARSVRRVSRTW